MSRPRPVIALTMGDPAGIGPEVCLRTLADREVLQQCIPAVFGDAVLLLQQAQLLGIDCRVRVISRPDWLRYSAPSEACIVDFGSRDAATFIPGEVDARTGSASFQYVDAAIADALHSRVAAIATAPIHKAAWAAAGIPFPGHTELLQHRTNSPKACMMLTADSITCSLVTTHIGLADVAGQLRSERILDVIRLTAAAVEQAHQRPARIAVLALNPHGGEDGLFGNREEQLIIQPAIADARAQGVNVTGPLAADTAFIPAMRQTTDAYVCMYHDQGLIPLKMIAFDSAVNTTLGLPIIRTSADHGTALDIAGRGIANSLSMRNATLFAASMAANPKRQSLR